LWAVGRSTLGFLPLLIAGCGRAMRGRGRRFALRKKPAQNVPWANAASSSKVQVVDLLPLFTTTAFSPVVFSICDGRADARGRF